MFKIFTLAVAVCVIPVSQNITPADFGLTNKSASPVYIFPYKNTITANPFEAPKKTTEAWSQNWMAAAQENIRKSEYNFKWEEKLNAYCTPNRKNNLRFFYTERGFTVEPRTTQIPIGNFDPMSMPDEIKYKAIPNWKVKFNLNKNQVGKGFWKIAENRAEYITNKITVQYINNDDGMRQNFIVHSSLSKNDELKINLNIKTKLKTVIKNNHIQFLHKKNTVLLYKDLKVWDATGKILSASFQKNKNKYFIKVDTRNVVYPITIDPISTGNAGTPDWVGNDADQVGASFGTSVASAGDVNGDGYSDVIIGAPRFDEGASFDEGKAFVYHGSAAGLSLTPNNSPDDVDQTDAFFGACVAGAGDVNGDGYSDVIIGAYLYNDGFADEGKAFVYHGSATGLLASPASTPADANLANAKFGISVACAGDVNGDGYSDVIIGASEFNDGPNTREGRAYLYYGGSAGINASPNNTLDDADQIFAYFGFSVASAGDVNGDGYSDVVIGAYSYDEVPSYTNDGRIYVYHGSAVGLSALPINILDGPNENNANLGISVACAGDVNGDGYSDIIAGAPFLDDGGSFDEGAAFIYFGSAAGSSALPDITLDDANQAYAAFGVSVASAGDVNGDGYSDVIVGANLYDDTNANEGVSFIYNGNAAGIMASPVSILDDANQDDSGFGSSVASAGDVNGDGFSDVIIGAYFYIDGVNAQEGVAFVYHGSPAGLSTTPNNTPDDADQADCNFGFSVASAGDVDADGYSDIIIGTPQYDELGANVGRAFVYHGSANGLSATPDIILDEIDQALAYFGWSVASAGDVNGDGYSDVIVGASQYDDAPFTNEGRAFVYHGSATGLSLTANSTLDDADQAGANFGISVAGAGDVNADGYSDVIIGAYLFNDGFTDEGAAFVYHGSATGLSATPNSMPDDADQLNANFGISVACAGDVNGDGYSDVIIGATGYDDPPYNNEGRAFIYYGSAIGLPAAPNSFCDDAEQANTNFGVSVSLAGDVNGDGYSDVIIGANSYDVAAFSNEGAAFVYHGSAAGLSALPNNTFTPITQVNAVFGGSVASAGDVNGDGYSDVIVGAYRYNDAPYTSEGRAFIYHGSASGLSATPNSTPDDADLNTANFGYSVACAGDINGDGYSDVIIGAYGFTDGPNVGEGRAFVYNGNDSTNNKRNNLRLYNTNLTTPINSSNFTNSNFGAGLFAKSFLGRDKGKLVWETRLNYNAYSGNPITNSTFFTAQQNVYTNLGLAGAEIKNIIDKILAGGRYTKVRARVKYNPVTAITGQVYGPWRNVSAVIDGNRPGALPINLISFTAAWLQKGKTAKLDFTTDKEIGICCFDIEKSADGFNFYNIGTLPAKNVSGVQSYSFIDADATNKKQFYRLKIKGITGQIEYSNIHQLQNNTSTEILVFPNPTTDVLQLQLNKVYDKLNMQIINNTGQLIKQLTVPALNQIITIPVQNLAAGKYWLHLQAGNEKQVLQFVKQ